ncbi:hypothetical protein AAMO2058_001639100 [Amorphochlora amoebiformis]
MFDTPHGIAVDRKGVIYVADTGNHRIRAIVEDEDDVSTFAGWFSPGYQDGLAMAAEYQWDVAARMTYPFGVCVDRVGNIHVADTFNNCYRWIALGAMVKGAGDDNFNGFFPAIARAKDGTPLLKKRFSDSIILNRKGYWYMHAKSEPRYVARAREGETLPPRNEFQCVLSQPPRPLVDAGVYIHTLAGRGSFADRDGQGTNAEFMWPQAVAADSKGGIYGTIHEVHHKIKHIDISGNVTTIAGSEVYGSSDGMGSDAEFHAPYNLATDHLDNIYIADTFNSLIRKVSPNGNVTTIAGMRRGKQLEIKDFSNVKQNCQDGHPLKALFNFPYGLTLDYDGNIYVGDTLNNRIRKISILDPIEEPSALFGNYDALAEFDSTSNSSSLMVDTDDGTILRSLSSQEEQDNIESEEVESVNEEAFDRGISDLRERMRIMEEEDERKFELTRQEIKEDDIELQKMISEGQKATQRLLAKSKAHKQSVKAMRRAVSKNGMERDDRSRSEGFGADDEDSEKHSRTRGKRARRDSPSSSGELNIADEGFV